MHLVMPEYCPFARARVLEALRVKPLRPLGALAYLRPAPGDRPVSKRELVIAIRDLNPLQWWQAAVPALPASLRFR